MINRQFDRLFNNRGLFNNVYDNVSSIWNRQLRSALNYRLPRNHRLSEFSASSESDNQKTVEFALTTAAGNVIGSATALVLLKSIVTAGNMLVGFLAGLKEGLITVTSALRIPSENLPAMIIVVDEQKLPIVQKILKDSLYLNHEEFK